MPRKRGGLERWMATRPWLRKALRPLAAVARPPTAAWRVYVRRSLAHPRYVSDPYPLYRWLREREPVRQDPLAPVWIVTKYDDAASVLRDPRFRKDPFAAERLPRATREQLKIPAGSARSEIETVSMLFLDPPEHTRVRATFTRAFSPKVIESMRPRIAQITRERLDRAKGSGMIDIIGDLAYPLPVMIIAELLGFPASDYERIKQWSDDMAGALSLNPSQKSQQQAGIARDELREYFNVLVPDLKRRSDNLLSALLDIEREPGALNREEIFSNAVLLLAAGHETTTNLIGNGVLALLENPEQYKLLHENPPKLIDNAVEEMLRYDSPVQWTSRVAGEVIEVGGKAIERGQVVLACLGAANRDPAAFENPETFDIRRANAKNHIAFGQGPHFCLGATLARMEASIAIGELARRFSKLRLAKQNLPRLTGLTFRGVKQLPVYVD
jgi:cytochrome P450